MLTLVRTLTGNDNPSTQQAIAWAVRRLGSTTASMIEATADEVAAVDNDDALVDLAELRLLDSMYGNLTAVTNQSGPIRDDYNDLARRLETLRKEKRAYIQDVHGIDVGGNADTPTKMAKIYAP